MSECSAQTKVSPSGITAQNELQTTLRGLELIKSCAKFYANGAGVAKPTVKLSHRSDDALNGPAIRQTSPLRVPNNRASALPLSSAHSFWLAWLLQQSFEPLQLGPLEHRKRPPVMRAQRQ